MAEIIVNGSTRIYEAIRDAKAGDIVLIPDGLYTVEVGWDNIATSGIIVSGQSREGVIIQPRNFGWHRGVFNVTAPSTWRNFTLVSPRFNGNEMYYAPFGMKLSSSDVIMENVSVKGFAESGIFIESQRNTTFDNVTLRNINVQNSAKEQGAWARGNIMIQANLNKALFENIDITHTSSEVLDIHGNKFSGYAIKFSGFDDNNPTRVKDSTLRNITTNGKSLSAFANSKGNISVEGWKTIFENTTLDRLNLNTQLSLAENDPTSTKPSIILTNSRVSTEIATTFECSIGNLEVRDTYFDMTKNDKNWHVLGEFNSGDAVNGVLKNQKFTRCTFDFGTQDGRLMTYTCPIEGITFDDCVIKGNAGQTIKLLEIRRVAGELRSDVVFNGLKLEGNVKVDSVVEFTEGATNKFNKGIKLNAGTVVVPPIEPPVIPNPQQPEIKRVFEEDSRYPGYLREVTLIKKK